MSIKLIPSAIKSGLTLASSKAHTSIANKIQRDKVIDDVIKLQNEFRATQKGLDILREVTRDFDRERQNPIDHELVDALKEAYPDKAKAVFDNPAWSQFISVRPPQVEEGTPPTPPVGGDDDQGNG